MANLPSGNMLPTTSTSAIIYVWCILIIILSSYSGQHGYGAHAWITDVQPTLKIKYDQKWPVFYGNQSDYYQILDQDDNSMLIGARNAMYNISLKNLREDQTQRLEWESTPAHRELCTLKGKQDFDCQNYIRVFARIDDNKVMVCGTNSYKPLCRRYKNGDGNLLTATHEEESSVDLDSLSTTSENIAVALSSSTETDASLTKNSSGGPFELIEEIDGQGRCPYNPTHNSSYIFTDGQLYSATAADFSGGDALIYRETQRTEQFNAKQLNQPSFVSTLERNGYVFFFFRELALENCGKTIYSRVARVCKNDRGGPAPFRERWTSYLKTRLNCSTPGDFPFYFDELQGTTGIIEGLYEAAVNQQQKIRNYHTHSRAEDASKQSTDLKPSSLIYAVFTTPQNAIPGSAVCAFQIDDIIDTFEGNFKGQKDSTSNWLPIPASEVPEPRPGKCVDDSRNLPMNTVNFVKMHTLMDSAVPALYGRPVLTRVTNKHRFTAITTDPQVESLNGDKYDIIFIGTDNGHVVKSIHFLRPLNNTKANQNGSGEQQDEETSILETVVISETQALPRGLPVKQMTVGKNQQSMVIVGSGVIVSIPMHHCSHKVSCKECLDLHDPYCVWDTKNHECTTMNAVSSHNRPDFIQNIRQSKKETIEMCGDDTDNRIDSTVQAKGKSLSLPLPGNVATNSVSGSEKPVAQPSVVSTRGTVSSVGREPPNLGNDGKQKEPDTRENEVNDEEVHANANFDDDFDGDDIDPAVVLQRKYDAVHSSNSNNMRLASPMFVTVVFIVFAVGLAFGFIVSKRVKFAQSPFDILRSGSGGSSSSHHHLSEHHRNQLNFYDKSTGGGRNASCKDVNLLMNVMGPYIAAGAPNNVNGRTTLTNTGCQTPNNLDKKDILEMEFETKDRSHECKNSTEHLDINDLKVNANNNTNTNCNNQTAPTAVIVNSTNTGTLQKVKKTYL